MKIQINKRLLPIKAHFFFFFAALGPLLPQMNVFGRQLGVSPAVMGYVTAVLPLLWAAAKPLFGYLVDFFPSRRKFVFMSLIVVMTGSYCCLWFLPVPDEPDPPLVKYVYRLNDTISLKKYQDSTSLEKYVCYWNCSMNEEFEIYLSNTTLNTIFTNKTVTNSSCSLLQMDFDDVREGQVICSPRSSCNLLCYEEGVFINKTGEDILNLTGQINNNKSEETDYLAISKVSHATGETKNFDYNFYMTATFWAFVVFMCIGTVAFNVANCIGDAVCFDVLGTEGSKYGAQRAWGTIGYGVTALVGGWLIDSVSDSTYKDFTPAFIVAIIATAIDLFCCRTLKLPPLSSPDDSGKALREVLRIPKVLVFITFAVVAGTFDSFIIYYMFWFLEELAEETGSKAKIKLIEGVVVAVQSLIGELLFFLLSGKIIKRWGFGRTLSFSLLCYGVRMALVSFIQHPWHLIFIEAVMQGPTYALCYSCIVGYAAHVAPEGYSATVQGIVAGMDDGLGFAIGSLLGGQLYTWFGGRGSFRCLSVIAVVASVIHALLFARVTREDGKELYNAIQADEIKFHNEQKQSEDTQEEETKMLPEQLNIIYRDTTVAIEQNGDR